MASNGNVMVCEGRGRQLSMPSEHGASHKQSLNERVRSYAQEQGWNHTEEGDFCPEDAPR